MANAPGAVIAPRSACEPPWPGVTKQVFTDKETITVDPVEYGAWPADSSGIPAAFCPGYSSFKGGQPGCAWGFGGNLPGSTTNFGANAQYGSLLKTTYPAFGGGGSTVQVFNNFRSIMSNACRRQGTRLYRSGRRADGDPGLSWRGFVTIVRRNRTKVLSRPGRRGGIKGAMFVGHEMTLAAAYPDACAGLVGLTHGGWLSDASSDAYAEGMAGLVRVGPFGEMPGASKLVRVLLLEPVERENSLTLSLRWEATGPMGALFPVLDANIILIPAGENACRLALAGAYRPPFAVVGEKLDRMLLHRAASATVRSLLRRIAETIAPDRGPAAPGPFPVRPDAGGESSPEISEPSESAELMRRIYPRSFPAI